jgi:glycosyltransferase involved in cell wall biosynthesis
MKIVVFFEYSTINGGENSMLLALSQLQNEYANQFQLVAAVTDTAGPLIDRLAAANIETTTFFLHDEDGSRLGRDNVIAQLNAMSDTLNADLFHGNSLSMARLLGAARRFVHCSTVSHIRDIMKLSNAAVADVNHNDRLIAVSHATRDFHVQENGIERDRVEVIYNGIEVHSTADDDVKHPARARIRSELGIPHDSFVVLTVGQICLRKGLDTLAQAAVQLNQLNCGMRDLDVHNLDVHFILAGERFSTKQESIEYEQAVHDTFALASSIRFHPVGFRTDVTELMSASDVLVHAARQEPLGRVLLEAAATGLPIIASNVGGTPEIVTHQKSGILVEPGNATAIAESILHLAERPEFRKQLAANAMQVVQQKFSIKDSVQALAETWQRF